jgi:hypothetical protein
MAGGKSVSENYAFAGMHHIFDQHTDAGNLILVQIMGTNHNGTINACNNNYILESYEESFTCF